MVDHHQKASKPRTPPESQLASASPATPISKHVFSRLSLSFSSSFVFMLILVQCGHGRLLGLFAHWSFSFSSSSCG
jgi:hypothetical protein